VSGVSYVAASALLKLVVAEPESAKMERWFVESGRVLTSTVGVIETRRAASSQAHDATRLAYVLRSVEVIEIGPSIADRAGIVGPPTLRTLDAIHLATALALQPDLDGFATYDDRLAAAARGLGLPVVSPA
jgi:predicted nucleic acid-binding protein